MDRRDILNDPDPVRFYGAVRARVVTFIQGVEGIFHLRDVYDYCDAHDDRTRNAVRQAVYRAKNDEIIKTDSNRAGYYRRVDNVLKIINLSSLSDEPPLDVKLPLDLDMFVEVYPKDLVVFAGVPNEGKTTFLLESLRLNMERFPCFYFSSEMGARACAKRISKHSDTLLKDWRINFVDSFTSYTDIIQPDALNFIDYIEAPDGEAFRVPSIMAGIHQRLQNGIAFIALQKNPGTDHGIGGTQTRAKPSVFCTLEDHTCKVVKAKSWRGVNPHFYTVKYKIRDGINLSRVGNWTPP